MESLEKFQYTWLQRQHSRKWDRGLLFIFAIGIVPALYPLVRYVDVLRSELWIPLALILGVIATHAAVTLRTVLIGARTSVHVENWDVLALTGVSARQWVFTNWRAVIQQTVGFHILFAFLRLGLAIAMAQLLHSSAWSTCSYFGLGPFCYQNYFFYGIPTPSLSPFILKIILAGVVIIIFSMVEALLLAAISLGISIRFRQDISPVISVAVRSTIVGMSMLLWILAGNVRNNLWMLRGSYPNGLEDRTAWAEVYSNLDYAIPLLDQVQVIVSIPADNGTLLAADLMRPTWGIITMVRNIPSVILGLLVYAGLIRGILWLAVRQAVRQGMLPEKKEAGQYLTSLFEFLL